MLKPRRILSGSSFERVIFILTIFALTAAMASCLEPTTTGPAPSRRESRQLAGRPNIVFILTDDLALNLVQYMPHVLKMQKDGVTFANYFVTDSLCCPSRASIFTGRYPHNTGIFTNTGADGGYLAFLKRGLEQTTFATSLSAAGYRTAMFGKYLNGYLPRAHRPAPGWTSWAVGGNAYAEFNYFLNQDDRAVHHGNSPTDYLTDVLSDLAIRFIKHRDDRPFLVEIATFAPHAPYTPAPRDAQALPGLRAPRTAAFNAAPDANAPKWLLSRRALSDADAAKIDESFRKRAQSVLAVDKMIGELQAAVAAIGKERETYFIFSSDNGLHMGEHRMMPGKMTAYETDIHVPLIVTGPGVPAGRTVEEVAENIDLYPTFFELGGAGIPPNVDGRSLVPLLHGQNVTPWRTAALIEHHGPNRDPADPDAPIARSGNPPTYEAIRTRTSLYVEYADGDKEYYDLVTDPYELRNTFSLLSREEKASLHAELEAIKSCHGATSCLAAEHASRRAAQR
jgi:arylsulfatase A-like enzyme